MFSHPLSGRVYAPHKLQNKKGKWYVSVTLPNEVRHLHSEARIRRSTGTNDKAYAEMIARDEIVPQIWREIDGMFDRLDPFVEELRPLFEKCGVDVGTWYTEGKVVYERTGAKTGTWQLLGGQPERNGKPVSVTEQFEVDDYKGLTTLLGLLGYALPTQALAHLDTIQRHSIEQTAEEQAKPRTEKMLDMSTEMPEVFGTPTGKAMLANAFYPEKALTRIAEAKPRTILFSELAERYIAAKAPKDNKDVAGKRKRACEMFQKVCGNKPISDYDKVHMLDMCRYMDDERNGKRWSNKAIQNYVSYTKQAFDYAGETRGETGELLLPSHPFHNLKLSDYGVQPQSYKPFTKAELHKIFALDLPPEDRLLMTILVATGMRLDEGALLTWERVREHDGVLCFSLIEDEVSVKNEGSRRFVPVPDVVIPLLPEHGKGRLFSYTIDERGKAENAASKALMRHVRKVTKDQRKVVHSFRGTLKDLLRDIATKEINDFITGHSQGDVAGDRYGDGPSMQKRLEALNAVDHPWLQKAT